ETDDEYQKVLDWVQHFVTTEIEPLDHVVDDPYDINDHVRAKLIPPLQEVVREHKLWACHLGPELGGPGYGQVKLALLNEILGRTKCGPVIFGCQAPDSGNAEILAHYGTEEQKARYLAPLLHGQIVSCFSMTEPQGGADPTQFTLRAELDGDRWVLNGEKWFSSNAEQASFFITMAVTDPDGPAHQRLSALLVDADSPGIEIVRNVGVGREPIGHGAHAYVRYRDVVLPKDALLGGRGEGFVVAQTRLGGGRIHHAMRAIGLMRRALEMSAERVLSRVTKGEPLAYKQLVQEKIADSWIDLETFRLLVLQTAWKIDKYQDYKRVRADIAAVKAHMPRVLHDVSARAIQLHGSLGVSNEMPLVDYLLESFHMGIADGPTEVHKLTLAREVLKDYKPTDDLFPSEHLLRRQAEARARYDVVLTTEAGKA
ncbi:MAG TPA: acyl-CoA dehydrogenase family protein, partial [Propionibacteriaceae bacterium]